MNGGRIEAGRQLERLFEVGTVGGLSDAELLERFAAVDDEAAGAAFEAIVERHGPMVLRVCRMVLRDAHAAEDAFQATFLVLARRARTLGERELLGNWLYGVAARTARKARIAAARRVARDRVAAGRRPEAIVEPASDERADELGRVLHEEIDRLPGSYRAAVVACYLEGLTQAQAAQAAPAGGEHGPRPARPGAEAARKPADPPRRRTGRRTRSRWTMPPRRASGPFADVGAATAARLPDAIVRSVARDALHFARSAGPATRGAVPSTAHSLADGVLSTMWLPSLKTIALAAALAAVGLGLTAAAAAALSRRSRDRGRTGSPRRSRSEAGGRAGIPPAPGVRCEAAEVVRGRRRRPGRPRPSTRTWRSARRARSSGRCR